MPKAPDYRANATIWADYQMVTRTSGSVLYKSVPFGVVSMGIAMGLGYTDTIKYESIVDNAYSYQVFSICVCFTLVFRTQISYQRYWESVSMLHTMSSKLIDVALQALTFDAVYDERRKDGSALSMQERTLLHRKTDRFKRRMMHLCSLTHAVSLISLRGRSEDLNPEQRIAAICPEAKKPPAGGTQQYHMGERDRSQPKWLHKFKVPVLGGITELEKEEMLAVHDQVTLCMSWMVQLMLQRIHEGGLRVSAPLHSRLLQELSNFSLSFHQVIKIVERPFPFPYTQVIWWLLMVNAGVLPIVMLSITPDRTFAALICLFAVVMFFALELVARELENSFGSDANDIDFTSFQEELNASMESMLASSSQMPNLRRMDKLLPNVDARPHETFNDSMESMLHGTRGRHGNMKELLPTMDKPLSALPEAWDVETRSFWTRPGEDLLKSESGIGNGADIVATAPDFAEFYSMPVNGRNISAELGFAGNPHAMLPEDRKSSARDVRTDVPQPQPPQPKPTVGFENHKADFEVLPEDHKAAARQAHAANVRVEASGPQQHASEGFALPPRLDARRLQELDQLLMLNSTSGPRFTSPDDCANWLSTKMNLPAEHVYRYAAELMLQRSGGSVPKENNVRSRPNAQNVQPNGISHDVMAV